MSFLRFLTVVSFRQYNPDWHIKIHRPKVAFKGDITWKSHEHGRSRLKVQGQYADRLEDYKVEFVDHDFEDYGFRNDVPETFKSDFLRWRLLRTEGGAWSDFDILYFRPMTALENNKKENCEVDTGLCPYHSGVQAVGLLLSSVGNPLFTRLEELARNKFDPHAYQSIGTNLFYLEEMNPKRFPLNLTLIPPQAVYFLDWQRTRDIFINNVPIPNDAIGIHWYAGDPVAQEFDGKITADNVTDFRSTICNAIMKYVSIKPSQKKMVSIIMPSFRRHELLKWGLWSIAKQKLDFDHEIVVLNDGLEDETQDVCKMFSRKLNIRYIFTGQRNTDTLRPRIPGFPINIGVKQSLGDIVILTCPEIFHIQDNVLNLLVKAVRSDPLVMATPRTVSDDLDGSFLEHVRFNFGDINEDVLKHLQETNQEIRDGGTSAFISNPYMPYLIAMKKSHFMNIGGYDEDFIGTAADDNDLMDRLVESGCKYELVDADVVHLYHGGKPDMKSERYLYNVALWKSRKGVIERNKTRLWGVL